MEHWFNARRHDERAFVRIRQFVQRWKHHAFGERPNDTLGFVGQFSFDYFGPFRCIWWRI